MVVTAPGAHAFRLVAVTAALTVLFTLINPIPASAHIVGTGGSATNIQTRITAIRPAVPTVAVALGLGGQWVRVTNQGAAEIVILGYRGDPFLRLFRNQVQVNQLSPTATETGMAPGSPAPGSPTAGGPTAAGPTAAGKTAAGKTAEPRWVRSSDGDSATWADARIGPPPASQQASGPWQLPLLVDGQQVTTVGTWDLIPPPSPWPWVAVLVLLTAAVAAIGWMRDWHRPMAAVVAVGILAFVAHVLGTGFAPQQSGPLIGWVGVGLVVAFALLVGVVSTVSTLRRSESAPDRAVTVGAIILLLAATDISVLWNSQLPFPGPGALDRGLTVIFYAAALGLIVAGIRLVRVVRSSRIQPGRTTG
jgi:hypothetical protein